MDLQASSSALLEHFLAHMEVRDQEDQWESNMHWLDCNQSVLFFSEGHSFATLRQVVVAP